MPDADASLRCSGPNDPVRSFGVRESGATGVVIALEAPDGEGWTAEAIAARKSTIVDAGLDRHVAESLPVHEGIKAGRPDTDELPDAYRISLRNLAENGIDVVTYNFPPIGFVHLRPVAYEGGRTVQGATRLKGDADMPAIVLDLSALSTHEGRSLPMRPDQGHRILDDVRRTTNPGCPLVGRMRGVTKVRGPERGIAHLHGLQQGEMPTAMMELV